MPGSLSALDWPAIRRSVLALLGLAAAFALLASFGYALYLGLSQPGSSSAEITAGVRDWVAGPIYSWVWRLAVVVLALAQGFGMSRRAGEADSAPLADVFVMALAALAGVVLLRLGIDLLFAVPVTVGRILFDMLMAAAALAAALGGAWLAARRAMASGSLPPETDEA